MKSEKYFWLKKSIRAAFMLFDLSLMVKIRLLLLMIKFQSERVDLNILLHFQNQMEVKFGSCCLKKHGQSLTVDINTLFQEQLEMHSASWVIILQNIKLIEKWIENQTAFGSQSTTPYSTAISLHVRLVVKRRKSTCMDL